MFDNNSFVVYQGVSLTFVCFFCCLFSLLPLCLNTLGKGVIVVL